MPSGPELYDKGLAWDDTDEFINQDWAEYQKKVKACRGGLGIAAADFDELLRYGYGLNPMWRREQFSKLVQGAQSDEDLDLLAKIMVVLYILPAESNLVLGWFFHRLRRDDDEFDAERAAKILNRIYEIHYRAGRLMSSTLRAFVDTYENKIRLLDEMIRTGLLDETVTRYVRSPTPKVALLYDHADSVKAERLYRDLANAGFKVSHELPPEEQWEVEIREVFHRNEFAVLCLSSTSARSRGRFQIVVKMALRMQQERSTDDIYTIPVTFDQVVPEDLPEGVRALHHIDLTDDWAVGVSKIVNSILKYHRVE